MNHNLKNDLKPFIVSEYSYQKESRKFKPSRAEADFKYFGFIASLILVPFIFMLLYVNC